MDTTCIKEKLQKCLNEERFLHTLGVADAALKLAQKYGLDCNKAYLAGLLHDCAKCETNENLLKIINEKLPEIDKCELQNYKTFHAPVGAYFAQTVYGVNDEEILNSIKCHTIGKLNMTLFEKIIYLADKIEDNTRDKEHNALIWEILNSNEGEAGLNLALLKLFGETIKSLVERELKICKTTIDVYNEFLDSVKKI